MNVSTCVRSPQEQQLDALIAKYYEAVEQGHSVDQADFLRQHPEFATELREYWMMPEDCRQR